jgi:Ca-activated chloride channel family protein
MLAVDLSGLDAERGLREGRRADQPPPGDQARHPGLHRARTSDRIGVVLFSSKAYTLSPLTTDHAWLAKQLERVKIGLITDGTAIGDALGVALTRLDQADKEDDGKAQGRLHRPPDGRRQQHGR